MDIILDIVIFMAVDKISVMHSRSLEFLSIFSHTANSSVSLKNSQQDKRVT